MAKTRKGGLSKQMRKKNASKTTRAGLSPELYEQLQMIPVTRDLDYPMGAEAREQLERKIEAVKAKIHKTDKAIEFQHQILDRVSSLSRYYDRAHYVLENLSMHTTTLQQVLLRLEADLAADDLILSERLAHDLQISEVQSHRVIFGRLDWPGNPDRPGPAPSRGLRERSTNVPTPRKWYQPSTSADARRQVPEPEVPQQRRVLALRSPATPSVLDQAIIFTPVVKFKKCVHRRLHRLVSPSDMKAMKLLLQKSCENVCGKSTDATYTLAPPLGRKPKPVKMASLEDSSPLIEEVIEVPPATLTAPTKNEDNANHEGDDNEARKFSDQVNDEVIEYGSADWPIQLDGLNVDQILNLSTEPEDNGHHHLSDCDSSYTPETPQYENSSPIGVRFARSPNYPCLDSPRFPTPPDVFGRATPCNNCPNYTRLGYCWCPDVLDNTAEWISMGCSPFDSKLFDSSINEDHESVPDTSDGEVEP